MPEPIAHGYDWAWAQIGGASVKSNGGTFVVRYLLGSASLTAVERDNLHRDGVNILLVAEQEPDAAEKGFDRGVQMAEAANAEADTLGYPPDALLLYADDQNDPDPLQEIEFKKGVNSVAGRPSDLYSGGNVLVALDHAGLRSFGGWMVETWYPNAGADPFMVQLANTRDPAMADVDAGSYDTNLLYRAVPMWGPDGTTTSGEDDMPLSEADLDKIGVKLLQYHDRFVSPVKFVDGSEASLLKWVGAALKVQAAGGADELAKAIVAKLPASGGGGLSKADVESALRDVLHSA